VSAPVAAAVGFLAALVSVTALVGFVLWAATRPGPTPAWLAPALWGYGVGLAAAIAAFAWWAIS
jgi:hypothetical protein